MEVKFKYNLFGLLLFEPSASKIEKLGLRVTQRFTGPKFSNFSFSHCTLLVACHDMNLLKNVPRGTKVNYFD